MTRVLQCLAGAEHGGAETYFVSLVLALHEAGLEQRVVMRPNRLRRARLEKGGIMPVELPFGGIFDWRTGRALRKEAEAFGADIVLSWMNRASAKAPRGNYVRAARLGGYYNLKYYKSCDWLIGITPGIVDHVVENGWPRDRAIYLPNHATPEIATPVSRASLDTPEDAPLLFSLGRMHPVKGFDVLLTALQQVPGAYLWLAGEGPARAELESLAKRLGVASRVRFLGWREDKAALFAAADIAIFPSRYEPFGTVTLEAWAYETPLVAAASAGPAGIITNERDALLVPIDDAPAMAHALNRLVGDPALRDALVAGGKATFVANFTKAAVVRRYLDFFERIKT
ncbi:MAG: glycosyl transferase [Rhodospirillaceae bacterium]|nr:MAG: glycosyl transferase [Rhodospirillaceae bacterium]